VAIEAPLAPDGFPDDVTASLAAWRAAPLLPISAAVLVIGSEILSQLAYVPLGLVLGLVSVGWLGTQLVWYKRIFDRQRIRRGELIWLTWSFIVRYLLLSILAAVPLIVVGVLLAANRTLTPDTLREPGVRIFLTVYVLVAVTLGTFMIPALAFSTRKVREAVPTGLKMLAQGWPKDWMYVLSPGLTGAVLTAIAWFIPTFAQRLLGIVSAVIILAFSGAIARYYLRHAS
jgi:hypothetical protein